MSVGTYPFCMSNRASQCSGNLSNRVFWNFFEYFFGFSMHFPYGVDFFSNIFSNCHAYSQWSKV